MDWEELNKIRQQEQIAENTRNIAETLQRIENQNDYARRNASSSASGPLIEITWKKILFIAAVGLVSQIFLGIGIGFPIISPILFEDMVFFQENQTYIYIIVGIVMFLLWLKTVRFLKKLFF